MKNLIIIFIFFISYSASANVKQEIDSILQLAKSIVASNPERTKMLANEAMELSLDNNYVEGQVGSYTVKGVYFYGKGNYDKAITNLLESTKIAEGLGKKEMISKTYNNVSIIYNEMGNYESALQYLNMSLKIKKELGISLWSIYFNQSMVYESLGNLNKALVLATKADSMSSKENKAKSLNRVGALYKNLKKYKQALKYYEKAIVLYNREKELSDFGYTMKNIGFIKGKLGKAGEGIINLNIALDIADSLGHKNLLSATYGALSDNYKIIGNYKKALEFQTLGIALDDSIYSEKNLTVIEEMRTKYETDKKDGEIELQKSQKLIAYGGIGVAILLIAFVLKGFLDKKKSNTKLFQKNIVIREKNKEILDSINYTKRIQEAILPSPSVIKQVIPSSFILYKPKDVISGDFYWTEQVGDLSLFAAADCTGHGVPGAMVSVVCHGALNRAVREFGLTDPGKILDKVREIVIETFQKDGDNVQDGMDIALCALNRKTGELQYAGANNPLYVVKKDSGDLQETKASKQPIGNYDNAKDFVTHNLNVSKGDMIYVSSDGYADQFGGLKEKKFMYGKFKKLLTSLSKATLEEQKDKLFSDFEAWKGDIEQVDDVCVIGVKI